MAYQKPPVEKPKKTNPDLAVVYIEKGEKNMDQLRQVAVYKNLGYTREGVDEDGTIKMVTTREKADAIKKDWQDEGRKRLRRTREADESTFGKTSVVRSGAMISKGDLRAQFDQMQEPGSVKSEIDSINEDEQ